MPEMTITMRVRMHPHGWRVVHHDFRRDVFTLERTRRFFKGRYRAVTGQQLVDELRALIHTEVA